MTTTAVDAKAIRDIYDRIHNSDHPEDDWHAYSTKVISSTIKRWAQPANRTLYNIGSGHFDYGLIDAIKLDASFSAVVRQPKAILGDAHALPMLGATADLIVCVGSVVNYVSLLDVLLEFKRVLKPDGRLILEYERSRPFSEDADILPVEVTYKGITHTCWYYSDTYVQGALRAASFSLVEHYPYHRCSHAFWRIHPRTLRVTRYLDAIFRWTPLSTFAANALLLCER